MEQQQQQHPQATVDRDNSRVAPAVAGAGGHRDEAAAAAAAAAHVRNTDSTVIAAAATTAAAPANPQQASPSSNNKRKRNYPKTRTTSFVKLSSEQILEANAPNNRDLPTYVKRAQTPELREARKELRDAVKLETKKKATLDLDRQEYEEFKKRYEQIKDKFEQSQQEHNEALDKVKAATLKIQEAELAKPCNWRDMYHKLLAFHAQHGHANVPQKRKRELTETDEEAAAANREHASFRIWLMKQKAIYRSHFAKQPTGGGEDGGGKEDESNSDDNEDTTSTTPKNKRASRKWNGHTPHRLAALEKLGLFVGPWERRYEELEAYKQSHGDCNVPTRSNNPALKDLGSWVGVQRTEYKKLKDGKKSHLTSERINKLEAIGFCFNVFEAKGIKRSRKN